MEEQQKLLIAKLKEAQNVLVTVSKNPSVDQLSAAIGLALALNKQGKHATAVYSGQTPSTLEFLKPDETLEKNTNSLRDFIIALDKSKADKLRYKVEDQVVRIFITPYKTSISQDDLDFSQGDFNVDVVVALGVASPQDLDDAIQAHGRILHDAVVSCVTLDGVTELGTLNVTDTSASSLSEIVTGIVQALDKDVVDSQIATALLTGIVATTDRFRNDHTTPRAMSMSAELMSAGANQQLIASELEAPVEEAPMAVEAETSLFDDQPANDPGVLEIDHQESKNESDDSTNETDNSAEPEGTNDSDVEHADSSQIHVDEDGKLMSLSESMLPKVKKDEDLLAPSEKPENSGSASRERVIQPPSFEGELTANTHEEAYDASTDELTKPSQTTPLLSHTEKVLEVPSEADKAEAQPPKLELAEASEAPKPPELPNLQNLSDFPQVENEAEPEVSQIDTAAQTLADLEKVVDSPHLVSSELPKENESVPVADVDAARNAVEAALRGGSGSENPAPIAALNAQPLGESLHSSPAEVTPQFQPAPGFGTPVIKPNQAQTVSNVPPSPTSIFPGAPQPSPVSNQRETTSLTTGNGTGLTPPPPVPPPPILPPM